MSLADELYRETILDHYHNPRNQGVMEGPGVVSVEGVNPLCGDELTLYLDVKDDQVTGITIKSRGCSINTASASMMTEVIKGLPLSEVDGVIASFKTMMNSKDEIELPEEMEELEALGGVRKYPVRIKCALLPWNTLIEALRSLKLAEKPKTITTE